MLRRWLVLGLLAVGLTLGPRGATAAENLPELRQKLGELAVEILKNTKNTAVTVGTFSPTGLVSANSGPGIEQMLTEELTKVNSKAVAQDAKFEVKGEYEYVRQRPQEVPEGGNPNLRVIRLTVDVKDKEYGESLVKTPLRAVLDATKTIAALTQPTGLLESDADKPRGDKESRNADLEKAVLNPKVHVHGPNQSLVSSTAESPYSIELLVKPLASTSPAVVRAAAVQSGMAFVDIKPAELYEIRIHNNTQQEVAVALSVDGLDVFHFSSDRAEDGQPRFGHYIVFPKGHREPDGKGGFYEYDGTLTVEGWHNSLTGDQNVLSFLVTGYGEGAVSKEKITARGKVGVIHAQFAKSTPLAAGNRPKGGNETGFGPPRKVEQVQLRREIEPPHDFVSIRYTR